MVLKNLEGGKRFGTTGQPHGTAWNPSPSQHGPRAQTRIPRTLESESTRLRKLLKDERRELLHDLQMETIFEWDSKCDRHKGYVGEMGPRKN